MARGAGKVVLGSFEVARQTAFAKRDPLRIKFNAVRFGDLAKNACFFVVDVRRDRKIDDWRRRHLDLVGQAKAVERGGVWCAARPI